MFDNVKISKRIRQARIDKNMTQMNLADAMGVSYQAVSNWERGNSLPDISKLEELCTVLGLTLQELLGIEESNTAAKAAQEEALTMEELTEVAPMLPPQTVKEHVEQERKRKKISISAIADIAPFLDEEYLDQLVSDADVSDLDCLDEIAPFLGKQTLEKLVETVDAASAVLDDVLCFLDKGSVNRLIRRCFAAGNMDTVEEAAPFASKEGLDAMVNDYIAGNRKDDLEGLYPFLSKSARQKLARYMLESGNMDGLGDIAAFL